MVNGHPDWNGCNFKNVFTFQLYSWCRRWIPSHCLGSLLLALPILGVLANFNCEDARWVKRDFYLQLVFISLAHFSNLSSLNYCVKSGLASIFAIVIMILYSDVNCDCIVRRSDDGDESTDQAEQIDHNCNLLPFYEVMTSISMLIVLVWLLNREFELSYRLSYHCSRLSARDRRKVQNLKNQADWLLHNIIPR